MTKIVLGEDEISGTFWFLISLIVIQQSLHMGVGFLHRPGPGGLSFLAGVTLAILSGCIAIKAGLRAREANGEKRLTAHWPTLKRLGAMVGVLTAYTFIFEHMGFFFSTFWLLVVLFRDPHRKRWWLTPFAAVATVLASYIIFSIMLQLPFPTGPWGIK